MDRSFASACYLIEQAAAVNALLLQCVSGQLRLRKADRRFM
jgi:hypothetical protein